MSLLLFVSFATYFLLDLVVEMSGGHRPQLVLPRGNAAKMAALRGLIRYPCARPSLLPICPVYTIHAFFVPISKRTVGTAHQCRCRMRLPPKWRRYYVDGGQKRRVGTAHRYRQLILW